jgi:hypothetical protein
VDTIDDAVTSQELHRLRRQLVARCGGLGLLGAAVATLHGAPLAFRILPALICAVPPALAWMAERLLRKS